MVDMTMMMMTLRYEVICNFKKSTTCLILKDTFKSQLNPLHTSINVHILHTVLKKFPEVKENLLVNHLLIISFILVTLMFDLRVML